MLSLDTLAAKINTRIDPDLCDAENEVAELGRLLTQMENIIKSRLQTKFSLLEDFFSQAISITHGFQEIGVDTSEVEARIALLQKAYVKVQTSLPKTAAKTTPREIKKATRKIPKQKAAKPLEDLPIQTNLDPSSSTQVIDVIPIDDQPDISLGENDMIPPKWTNMRSEIAQKSQKLLQLTVEKLALGYQYSAEKLSQGYHYSKEKITVGCTWLRARSPDEILFGARTVGSFSATLFAILAGIGLAAGWTAPGLAITFLISVSVFAGAELTQIIRSIIRKYHPQEVL